MDEADRQEPTAVPAGARWRPRSRDKAQCAAAAVPGQDLDARGLNQLVATEPEARLMQTPHGHAIAYKAQTAVDAEHN